MNENICADNSIPYRVRDHIHIVTVGNFTFYINLLNGGYIPLLNDFHKYIVENQTGLMDGLYEYIDITKEKLVATRYIEPDLSKLTVGRASVYVPKTRWKPKSGVDEVDPLKIYDIPEQKIFTPVFDHDCINQYADLSEYEYLCERNSLMMMMAGYGIKNPLLLMNAGLFIYDIDFMENGLFTTSFIRPMIDAVSIPVLGETKFSLDWEVIDSHLEKKFPVFVIVDVYYMPYKHNTYYHNSHGSHSIILLEKCEDNYLVLDWYHPDYFLGKISKEELTIARISSNEKDQISVFNGNPIDSAYRLFFPNRFPIDIDMHRYMRRNLINSAKCLLSQNGALDFFNKSRQKVPEWLKAPDPVSYNNAIECFFFLDLELKFLALYYNEMENSNVYPQLQPVLLKEKVEMIREVAGRLKYKLIVAFRRGRTVNSDVWIEGIGSVVELIEEYCESLLNLLKSTKL